MKKDKTLWVIRGSGYSIDGSIVNVVKAEGDYSLVSPANSQLDNINIMVRTACLQRLSENHLTVDYEFVIHKYTSDGYTETGRVEIKDAIRNIKIGALKNFITDNLKPILRME